MDILEQTCGSETVLEAVKRNEAETSQRALGVPVARLSGDSAVSSSTAACSPPEVRQVCNPTWGFALAAGVVSACRWASF